MRLKTSGSAAGGRSRRPPCPSGPSISGVLGISPGNAHSYNNRGFSYALAGKHQEAIEDYTKAIALDPEYANAYLNRSCSYRKTGKYLKAEDDFKKFRELEKLKKGGDAP